MVFICARFISTTLLNKYKKGLMHFQSLKAQLIRNKTLLLNL